MAKTQYHLAKLVPKGLLAELDRAAKRRGASRRAAVELLLAARDGKTQRAWIASLIGQGQQANTRAGTEEVGLQLAPKTKTALKQASTDKGCQLQAALRLILAGIKGKIAENLKEDE